MGAIATFNLAAFLARYPEFTPGIAPSTYVGVNSLNGPQFFAEAGLYWNNAGCSPVCDPVAQAMLMNLVTAHIAVAAVGAVNQPASGLVGRISSAGEGSVNVSTELAGMPGTAAWFSQTAYGLNFWQATAAFRTMHYRPGPYRRFGYPGIPGGW